MSIVVALAGRRIDRGNEQEPRFSLAEVPRVREGLYQLLQRSKVDALVCSAACGADLLALEAAGTAKIPRHIILPFPPEVFRPISVVDRPGPWGPLFDQIVEEVRSDDNLT